MGPWPPRPHPALPASQPGVPCGPAPLAGRCRGQWGRDAVHTRDTQVHPIGPHVRGTRAARGPTVSISRTEPQGRSGTGATRGGLGDPTRPCEGPDEDAPWHGAVLGADGRSTLRLVQEGEDRARGCARLQDDTTQGGRGAAAPGWGRVEDTAGMNAGHRVPGRGRRRGVNKQRPGACSLCGNEPGLSRPRTLWERPGEVPSAGLFPKNFRPEAPLVELSSAPRRQESSGPFKGEAGVPLTLESYFFFVQDSGR